MWIKRDFQTFFRQNRPGEVHPIKVLKGPRQVGKTSILEHHSHFLILRLDDLQTRQRAEADPRHFLDQFDQPLVLDEATLAPNLFPELKRRVDEFRRNSLSTQKSKTDIKSIDIWITGSNQTLLESAVQESLAGRASYFDLNTLSLHELGGLNLSSVMLKGGWPELHTNLELSPTRYLNDLISTFIEKDIVSAAGIERKAAFVKMTGLLSGRVGQLINASDLARNVGVETTTIQSWIAKLEQNAIVRTLAPYSTNLNQRLIKTPKIYFEDVGLASRLQGWTEFQPLYLSPSFGHLLENLALIEICRTFTNSGLKPEVFFLRTKEQVELDFLVRLSNNRWLAIEVKTTPQDFSDKQNSLLDQLKLNIVDKWVVSAAEGSAQFKSARSFCMAMIHDELMKLH